MKEILGYMKGLMMDTRKYVFHIPNAVSCLNQNPFHIGSVRQFNIHTTVSDDIGVLHINVKTLTGLLNQTRARFSAIARHTVLGHNTLWVMGTKENSVYMSVICCKQRSHMGMCLVNQFLRKIAARNPGLIRYDDDQILMHI